jgi:hypothetical protein
MHEAVVTEYVELCAQLCDLDVDAEERFYDQLDDLWYSMTDEERRESERRLTVLGNERAWHDDRRKEQP